MQKRFVKKLTMRLKAEAPFTKITIFKGGLFYLIYLATLITLLSGCRQNIVLPAGYDTALYANLAKSNINGKNEVLPDRAYGVVLKRAGAYVSYPIMQLNSGDELTVKDSFLLGGFDLTPVEGEIERAMLKFYINYSAQSRIGMTVALRPLTKSWDESTITYLDIYTTTEPGAPHTDLVESDESNCLIAYFSVEANPNEHSLSYNSIPLYRGNKTISIDITPIVQRWRQNPGTNHGLLIEPLWKNDLRYRTSNVAGEMSYSGIIEVAPVEWYDWNGLVPEQFTTRSAPWKLLTNRARGKMRFVPRIEVEVEK